MSLHTIRRPRKGLFLIAALALFSLAGMAKPTRAYCDFVICPFYMTSSCFGVCYCDCPIDPSGDPTDWSNCGPCV